MTTKPKHSIDALANDLGERSRDLWLAGLGAIATLEEESTRLIDSVAQQRAELVSGTRKRLDDLQREAEKTFQDFVKRGEQVEAKGRERLNTQVEAVKADVATTRKNIARQGEPATRRFDRVVATAVETVLERLDVPTRTEVKELGKQIDHLADRVNRLTTLLKQQATKVYHVVPHAEGWAVKQEGLDAPLFEAATKAEALDLARERAQAEPPSRLVVHRKNGTIMEQVAYGA